MLSSGTLVSSNFAYLVWWMILLTGFQIKKSTTKEAWVMNPTNVENFYFSEFWRFVRNFGP